MAILDDELMQDAALDAAIIEHVRNNISQEMKQSYTEELLYYFHDLIEEYLAESDILDSEADEEGYVNIDLEAIAQHLHQQAKKDKMGTFSEEELLLLVEAELSYGDDFKEE